MYLCSCGVRQRIQFCVYYALILAHGHRSHVQTRCGSWVRCGTRRRRWSHNNRRTLYFIRAPTRMHCYCICDGVSLESLFFRFCWMLPFGFLCVMQVRRKCAIAWYESEEIPRKTCHLIVCRHNIFFYRVHCSCFRVSFWTIKILNSV